MLKSPKEPKEGLPFKGSSQIRKLPLKKEWEPWLSGITLRSF